ncbi:MAG: hypothetical protein HYY20_03145 [Candidatus Tectomicrobia bacterium]|uniref:DUF4845 domain-containing protein n=1 Tax=Tectimicrobiota bacterium TaxID=2528274 RepID=A0A932FZZ0_UNCTE|nr:hypothetical protein [Candidatus Tectomicrobia bacterium]
MGEARTRLPGKAGESIQEGPAGFAFVKTLVFLLFIVAFFHGLIRVIPLYMNNLYFKDAVRQSAGMARAKGDDEILGMVMGKAKELGIPVTEENVTLNRNADGSIQIKVNYSVEVKFLGGFYRRFNFAYQTEASN